MTAPMAGTELPELDCDIRAHMTVGSSGADVSCLQQALIEAGLLEISAPTGFFGPLTKTALTRWQQSRGVPATGYFGPLSLAAFGHSGASPAAAMEHGHEPLDVSAWPRVPSVAISVHTDAMSGYNLEIKPVSFTFAPEHVNGAVLQNEGHAHLYINGTKITRVYGPWLHVSADLFKEGTNEVVVTLNANDHSDIAIGGVRVEAKTSITK